ncbi:dockerin type I domain-containing protein [Roseiconus lacunae]|uniref:Dockerin type I domain-containing protein n=1 Tax=Roseiconus lacunae TaxID=2605694 RepID=A0ABT7PN03_9BACT|nr:dockerin type I domain-containing protein [Roseiconus lacunae]MCD0462632.1 dockerin type I domain-containing protein [Roseiconus lacunae]MDM4017874.1 dockerin type I domain-containing protein [Roseiconus lacunae]WRQ52551.1 dockerin type I domain-containing protein [Stieleria sp. HD01]
MNWLRSAFLRRRTDRRPAIRNRRGTSLAVQRLEQRRLLAAEVGISITAPTAVNENSVQGLLYTITRDETEELLAVKLELSGDAQYGIDYSVDELDRDTLFLPEPADDAIAGDPVYGTATFYPGESTIRLRVKPMRDSILERDEQVVLSVLTAPEFGPVHGAAARLEDDAPAVTYLVDEFNRLGIVDNQTGIIDVLGTIDVPQVLNDIAILEDGSMFALTNDYLYQIDLDPAALVDGDVPATFLGYHGITNANAMVDARDEDFDSSEGDLFAVGNTALDLHHIDLEFVDDQWTLVATTTVFDIDATLARNGLRSDYISSGDLDYTSRGDLVLSVYGSGESFDSMLEIKTPSNYGVVSSEAVPAEDPDESFEDVFGFSFADGDHFAYARWTLLTVNRFNLNSSRELEMLGRPYTLATQSQAIGTIIGDPVTPPRVSLNVGWQDPPSLPHGLMPTTWQLQRTDLRTIQIKLGAPVEQVAPGDISLSTLGISGSESPTAIALASDQIELAPSGDLVLIHLDHDQMPDGRYQIVLSDQLTTGPEFRLVGDRINRFFSIDGDFDGNRVVDIRDFATLAYWYGNPTSVAPEYVDLDGSGFIDQNDFPLFAVNFGSYVQLPNTVSPLDPIYVNQTELTIAQNAAANPLDTNGNGLVSPLDALKVINRIASGSADNIDWRHDVNRDGTISPRDALSILNRLAAQASSATSTSSGEAEGEAILSALLCLQTLNDQTTDWDEDWLELSQDQTLGSGTSVAMR